MSTAFTTISDSDDLQDLDLVNEIQTAYSERRQAIGLSSESALAAGADIQAASFWSVWQTWIYNTVTASNWADHAASGGDYTGDSAIPWYTWSTFLSRAGLPAGGFRRVAGETWPSDWTDNADAAYSFGTIQAGDIIGPWLLVDLQRAFSALKWSTWASAAVPSWRTAVVTGERGFERTDAYIDCATVYAANVSAWSAGSWGGAGTKIYRAEFGVWRTSICRWESKSWRNRYSTTWSIPLSWITGLDLYGYTVAPPVGGTFQDIDGLGATANAWLRLGQITGASGTIQVGYSNTNPLVASGWTCANPITWGTGLSVSTLNIEYILKWDFTNA